MDSSVTSHYQLLEELRNGLSVYKALLEKHRLQYNLIGPHEDIEEHFADCLAPAHVFIQVLSEVSKHMSDEMPLRCVDLGTGAGLPGIPLALASTARVSTPCQWILLERREKKARFVQEVVNHIERALHMFLHAQVLCKDLREWKPEDDIHIVTARAFRPLTVPLLNLIKAKAPHAYLLFYKGLRTKLDEEFNAIENLIEVVSLERLAHPMGKERHMLVAKFRDV